MRTYSIGTAATLTIFDQNVFTREENYLHLHRDDPNAVGFEIGGTQYNFYDDDVYMEMSDYLLTLGVSGNISISIIIPGQTSPGIVVSFTRWDGVSPESNVLLPPSELPATPASWTGFFNLEFWYNNSFSTDATTAMVKQGGGTVATAAVNTFAQKFISLPTNSDYEIVFATLNDGQKISPDVIERYNLEAVAGGYKYTIKLKPLDCDKEYVWVKWVGRHGLLKDYVWEVLSRKTAVDSVIRYATTDNFTRSRKHGYGVTIETVARDIKGIDVHYLNDIAESNDVKIWNERTLVWDDCAVSETKTSGTTEKSDVTVNFELKTYVR